jgi:hypothetical protein
MIPKMFLGYLERSAPLDDDNIFCNILRPKKIEKPENVTNLCPKKETFFMNN